MIQLTDSGSQQSFDASARATTVLIVEDDPTNLKYFSTCIKRFGLEVETAHDGWAGVEAFKREPDRFALILMDLQMPNCSGEDAFKLIRNLGGVGSNIPVIAATAHASRNCRERCLELGMNDFLAKPCLPTEIAEVLKKWI